MTTAETKARNRPYLLYGEDDFSLHEFLAQLRQQIGPEEVRQANTTDLAGPSLTSQELMAACGVIPFLAERRLVVVAGLFALFEPSRERGRGERASRTRGRSLAPWDGLPGLVASFPETTTLAFVEGILGRDNPLLRHLEGFVEVREFRPLAGEPLAAWIRQRAAKAGASIAPLAVRRLMDLVGGNLWVLSQELEKLCLYVGNGVIADKAVAEVVPRSREVRVFAVVDAVLEGRAAHALQQADRLLREGAQVSYVLTMLARQLRLILLAQELLAGGLAADEVGQRLGLRPAFAVRRTVEQANRFGAHQVMAMYRSLLDVDLAIKGGELEEELALEMLVAALSARARKAAEGPIVPSNRSGPR